MPGIGRLIQEPGWLVVPVHIAGTFHAWPQGKRFPRLRPLSVHFGEPMNRNELIACGSGDVEDARLADGLRKKLSTLMAAEPSEATETHD
jgi:1-acyl-sn-glycerol-3-phosphate acyltransferase